MDFALSQDQRLIQDSARAFLADAAGLQRVHAVVDGDDGWAPELWSGLARDMGFAGLLVPEAYGGSGLGAVEMSLVLEETGRRLAPAPLFETAVLAVQAILAAGAEAQRAALLPAIAAGETRATFVGAAAAERPAFAGGRLSGRSRFVTFGHVADLLLVATADDTLLALPAATPGVSVARTANLDRTRPFATLAFDDVQVPPDAILGAPGAGAAAIARTLCVGAGLLASEQTGGAQFCLDTTVEYAQQRVQFGRLIGSYQAVKHALADMMVMIEASRSAALYAAAAIDEGGEELAEACAVAASWACDCYRHCSGEAIQLHGGIGFTWEHHAHLYFKRAQASSTWLGSVEAHREALARIILQEIA
jgi:alkylation response protein AidB-like acyl-CoA dehydrogenase